MRKPNFFVSRGYLQTHPEYIFVFGDNLDRKGKGGAAKLRDMPNSLGFITKKHPNQEDTSYYTPPEYIGLLSVEIIKLIQHIKEHPDKKYLISKLGSGLANKYGIWDIIRASLEKLESLNPERVILLW